MPRYKIDRVQELVDDLIEDLKKSAIVYDESIIYKYINKATSLKPQKRKGSTKAIPVKAYKILNTGAVSTRYFTSLLHAQNVTGIPASSISRIINNPKKFKRAGEYYWKKSEKNT